MSPAPSFAVDVVPLDALREDPANVRMHGPENMAAIERSLRRFGQVEPLIVLPDGTVVSGNGRLRAMRTLGWTHARVVRVEAWTAEMAAAYALAANRTAELGAWDEAALARVLLGMPKDLQLDAGFDELALLGILRGASGASGPQLGALALRFGVPPFSVLDARQGYWQDRRRAWLSLGIRSELGRGEGDRATPGGATKPGLGSRKDYPGFGARKDLGATLAAIPPNERKILKRTGSYRMRGAKAAAPPESAP